MAQIAIGNTPAGGRVVVELQQTFALRLLGDVEEELHHDITVIDQLAFECLDLFDSSIHRLACTFLHALAFLVRVDVHLVEHVVDERRIPASVKDSDGISRTKRLPKLLHRGIVACCTEVARARTLCFGWIEIFGDMDRNATRIEMVDKIGDTASFASPFPSFKEHDHSRACLLSFLLKHHQAIDERIVVGLVFFFGKLWLVGYDRLEHCHW